MPVFRRKNSHDNDIADCLVALTKQPLTDVQELEVSLTATTANQSFAHGLGRPYRGVIVVGQSAAVSVFASLPSAGSDPARKVTLFLSAATACTAKVLVY